MPEYRHILIDDIENIKLSWLDGVRRIGLTAGASAPEGPGGKSSKLSERIWAIPDIETTGGIVENVQFSLPPELAESYSKFEILTEPDAEKKISLKYLTNVGNADHLGYS